MSFIKASDQIENIKDDQQKFRYIQLFFQDTVNTVNGNLELLNNIKGTVITVNFTAANTNTTFNHSLGYVPNGYIMISATSAVIIYDGSIANTSNTITLKSSAIGSAQVLLF